MQGRRISYSPRHQIQSCCLLHHTAPLFEKPSRARGVEPRTISGQMIATECIILHYRQKSRMGFKKSSRVLQSFRFSIMGIERRTAAKTPRGGVSWRSYVTPDRKTKNRVAKTDRPSQKSMPVMIYLAETIQSNTEWQLRTSSFYPLESSVPAGIRTQDLSIKSRML